MRGMVIRRPSSEFRPLVGVLSLVGACVTAVLSGMFEATGLYGPDVRLDVWSAIEPLPAALAQAWPASLMVPLPRGCRLVRMGRASRVMLSRVGSGASGLSTGPVGFATGSDERCCVRGGVIDNESDQVS